MSDLKHKQENERNHNIWTKYYWLANYHNNFYNRNKKLGKKYLIPGKYLLLKQRELKQCDKPKRLTKRK